jgi:PPE-repeat protein
MTAPIWMASPPEVHSALLSSGPGPGSLLAAAEAWSSLGVEYSAAADELTALLSAVQAGAWDGPSAEAYVNAHGPYVLWLVQTSADSAAAAAQHETVAAGYTAALAAMPTLPELAANHVTHAALLATNFFGINTIPIAVNEADYVRMWIQAATTMITYEAVSAAALTSVPHTSAAPPVLKSGDPSIATDLVPGNVLTDWENFVQNVTGQLFGSQNPPGLAAALTALLENPSPATLGALVFALAFEVAFDTLLLSPAALLGAPVVPVVGLAGLGGLAGLAGLPQPGQLPATASQIPESPANQARPAVGIASAVAAPGTAASPATGASTPTSAPAPAPASAPVAGAASFGYLVFGGGPDEGEGPTLIDRGKAKAPSADIVAAVAAPARTSTQERSRRRRRTMMRGHSDEYVYADSDLGAPPADAPPTTTASNQGAGSLGFTGTVSKADGIRPEGLIALADDFGAGPTKPRLPQTWNSDPGEDSPGHSAPKDSGRADEGDE